MWHYTSWRNLVTMMYKILHPIYSPHPIHIHLRETLLAICWPWDQVEAVVCCLSNFSGKTSLHSPRVTSYMHFLQNSPNACIWSDKITSIHCHQYQLCSLLKFDIIATKVCHITYTVDVAFLWENAPSSTCIIKQSQKNGAHTAIIHIHLSWVIKLISRSNG